MKLKRKENLRTMGAQSRLIFLIIAGILIFWLMKSIEEIKTPAGKPVFIENSGIKDSLQEENMLLRMKITSLKERSDILEQKLQEKEQAIDKVRRKRDEKVARIDHLDSHELYRFFAEFNPKSGGH